MNYKTHVLGGAALGFTLAFSRQGVPGNEMEALRLIAVTGSAAVGALLPDIDEPSSTIGQNARIVSGTIKTLGGHRGFFHSPIALVLLWTLLEAIPNHTGSYGKVVETIWIALIPLIALRVTWQKHHKLSWSALIFAASVFLWAWREYGPEVLYHLIATGTLLGYLSHLLLDSLNRAGIPLLYPFTKRKFHIACLKTGRDDWIGVCISFLPAVILIARNLR